MEYSVCHERGTKKKSNCTEQTECSIFLKLLYMSVNYECVRQEASYSFVCVHVQIVHWNPKNLMFLLPQTM